MKRSEEKSSAIRPTSAKVLDTLAIGGRLILNTPTSVVPLSVSISLEYLRFSIVFLRRYLSLSSPPFLLSFQFSPRRCRSFDLGKHSAVGSLASSALPVHCSAKSGPWVRLDGFSHIHEASNEKVKTRVPRVTPGSRIFVHFPRAFSSQRRSCSHRDCALYRGARAIIIPDTQYPTVRSLLSNDYGSRDSAVWRPDVYIKRVILDSRLSTSV